MYRRGLTLLLKRFAKKLIQGPKSSSESYIAHLRKLGIKVGEDVTIYAPTKTTIDECYPWMISIGDHVRITQGVTILAHDYSWSLFKQTTGGIFGASGKVEIGNNVFVGSNSNLIAPLNISDSVYICAGTTVTNDLDEFDFCIGRSRQWVKKDGAKKYLKNEQMFEKDT